MSQADKLLELLSDGKPHSTVEIMRVVYGGDHLGVARIASRVSELRERGWIIESKPGKINKTVWWYRLTSEPEKAPEKPEPVRLILDRRSGRKVTIDEYQRMYA